MNNFFKKGITFALALTLIVTMCFGSAGTATAYAAEQDYPAVTVYDGDKVAKEFTLDELKAIAAAEGNIQYKFSGYNRNPSFYTFGAPDNPQTPSREDVAECFGPTVAGILAAAGVTYTDDQVITFAAPDMVKESFIAGDLFADRYYYPYGATGTAGAAAAPEAAYKDAEPVVPIIDLFAEKPDIYPAGEAVLRFGQIAPNEQNYATFVKYVGDGGSIIVGDKVKDSWPEITTANYSGGDVLPGTEIVFDIPKSMLGKKVAAYYTTDGTEPGYGDAIYNYNKYGDLHEIKVPEEGTITYNFKVIGYGKLDSEMTSFTYTVVDVEAPGTPKTFTAAKAGYAGVKLTWSKVADAQGYEILRYDAEKEEYVTVASILNNEMISYTDKGLATGTKYSYKVRAFKLLNSGQRVYGAETVAKTATPALAVPTLNSVAKTGHAGIQVKWSKVAEADGYEVLRTDAKGNKLTKIFTDNATVSWKNTGLKTGTKYTYKVRAYKVIDEETTIYSAYTGVKSATPALAKPVLKPLKAGAKSITVTWNKVAGANGYEIYRSTTGKAGSFKKVMTIKKGSTVSWKNTKLIKGKNYYYKVKAYRVVDQKNVYSSISSAKYIKSK